MRKKLLASGVAAVVIGATILGISMSGAASPTAALPTPTTPIEHVVVLFPENISFDHYFGTYPNAVNGPGEPAFTAAPGTPAVNGLGNGLLTENPNLTNPARLAHDQALTCDQNHSFGPEQEAEDNGKMDMFVQKTTGGGCSQETEKTNPATAPTGSSWTTTTATPSPGSGTTPSTTHSTTTPTTTSSVPRPRVRST